MPITPNRGAEIIMSALDAKGKDQEQALRNQLLVQQLQKMRGQEQIYQSVPIMETSTQTLQGASPEAVQGLESYGVKTNPEFMGAQELSKTTPIPQSQRLRMLSSKLALTPGGSEEAMRLSNLADKYEPVESVHGELESAWKLSGFDWEKTKAVLESKHGGGVRELLENVTPSAAGFVLKNENLLLTHKGEVRDLKSESEGSPNVNKWIATITDPNSTPEAKERAEKNLKILEKTKVTTAVRIDLSKIEGQQGIIKDETKEQMYQYYKTTGNVPQELLRLFRIPGAQAAAMNYIAKRSKEEGFGGDERAIKMTMFKAGGHAIGQLQTRRDNILAFEQNALQNAKQVYQLADKLDPAQIPILNKAILAGKTQIAGDPVASAYMLAYRTFINEYARVATTVTGGGVTSDTARKEMEDVLANSGNKDMTQAGLRQAALEMAHRKYGYDSMLNEEYKRLGSKNPPFTPVLPTEESVRKIFSSETPYVVPKKEKSLPSRKDYFGIMQKANPKATDKEINDYLDKKGIK